MKFESAQSHKIKIKCLTWLRLQQRCAFIATEAGPFAADVFGVSETKIIEIEVKISYQDLKNDFNKYKHNYYNEAQYGANYQMMWQPTHFYFCLPGELIEKARDYLLKKELAKKYGLINADCMSVNKNPRKLHKRESSSKVKFQMALRMGSELIRMKQDFVV